MGAAALSSPIDDVASRLAAAGCVAPHEEAVELLAAAGDAGDIDALVARRVSGEPLAWVVGSVTFCGIRLTVHPGVYVPRPHSEELARRAAALLPDDGVAVDLCTGSGAVARVVHVQRPSATVLATDVDPLAVACAQANGVDALLGDLDEPLPAELEGGVDVVVAVTPYVPTTELRFLPRDVVGVEPALALDGGEGGLRILSAVVTRSTRWLRPGGWLILEIGGDQASAVAGQMVADGFVDLTVVTDEEGDDRAIAGRRG